MQYVVSTLMEGGLPSPSQGAPVLLSKKGKENYILKKNQMDHFCNTPLVII